MEFESQQILWTAYTISNIVGLFFLWAAFKRPKLARILFAILFGWACWFNYTTSHQDPGAYLMYGAHSVQIYNDFINGWFKDHITVMVTGIAIGQGMISIGMLLKGIWVKLACIGAILFLAGIAPFGLYAAFPFSITVSIAAVFIIYKDDHHYLW